MELAGGPWGSHWGVGIRSCLLCPVPAGPQVPSTSSVCLASPSGWGLQEGRRSQPGSRGSPWSAPAVAPSSSDSSLRPEAADSLRAAALEQMAAGVSSSGPWEPEGGERARHPRGLQRTRGQGHVGPHLPPRRALSPPCRSPSCPRFSRQGPHTTQHRGQDLGQPGGFKSQVHHFLRLWMSASTYNASGSPNYRITGGPQ